MKSNKGKGLLGLIVLIMLSLFSGIWLQPHE